MAQKPNWTESQRSAIDSRGENLLLAAGAGSGKTAVLTERIAAMAMGGVPLKNMLVVTFTKAAAAEMRQRIQARLEEIARKDPEERNRIAAREQLSNFAQANISTLHAFCQNVLKRHFHEAQVDPGYRVGDELECAMLREDALELVLEEVCASDEAAGGDSLVALTSSLTDGREDVQQLILRCYNMMMALPDPWDWLSRSVAAYHVDYDAFRQGEIWREYLLQCRVSVQECLKALETIEEYTRSYEGYTPLYAEQLQGCLSCLRRGLNALDNGEETLPAVEKWPGLNSWKKGRPDDLKDLQERAKAAYKALPKQLSARSQWEKLRAAAGTLDTLAALIGRFHELYEDGKQKKALVDFSDLEHKTLKVLGNSEIAGEYRQRFQAVFVDEYQDTNRVQEAIVTRISRPGALFTVGDIKQSIYRFRAADPLLFRGRAERYARGDGGRRVDLRENFRSAPNVLLAVNDVFERAMPLSGGEVVYGEQERLLPGRPAYERQAPVTLNLLWREGAAEEFSDGEAVDEEERSAVQRQTTCVAKAIRDRMGAREEICDRGEWRALRYDDFAILLRTGKGVAEEVARVLAHEGIPAYTAISGGYFAAIEVQVLINLLRLIDNRRQDIPLLSVMRAGLFGFVDGDIVALRQRHPGAGSLHEAFFRLCAGGASSPDGMAAGGGLTDAMSVHVTLAADSLTRRCRALNAFLLEGKRRSRAVAVDALIDWAVAETRYELLTVALPGGMQRGANLKVLSSRARNYESSSAGGLHGFLRYLQRLERAGLEMAEAVLNGEGSDAVRVMTMHGSKGLEFPIVYMLNLEKSFNYMDARKKLLLHRDLGMGASVLDRKRRLRGKALPYDRIALKIGQETRAEELRMLYVAMTRAREELHMFGSLRRNSRGEVSDGPWREPGKQNSLLDFLLYALLDGDQAADLRRALGLERQGCALLSADWRIGLAEEAVQDAREENAVRKELLTQWEAEAVAAPPEEELATRYGWRYPQAAVAGKVTVSALASGRPHFDESPRFMEQRQMTAEDRGQALHSALEHLDWRRPLDGADIAAQLGEMAERELISPEQLAVIDPAILARFAASPLGGRMRAAADLKRELPFVALEKASTLGLGDSEELVTVQGVIDACFLEEKGWVLVDYKSDRVLDQSPRGLAAAAGKHAAQIGLYVRELERLTGRNVAEAYIFLLSVGEAVPIQPDPLLGLGADKRLPS